MKNRYLLLAVPLLFLFSGFLQAQDTFLWKVSGNGCKKSSYLFGTYHLLNDDYLQKYPKVLVEFEKATAIVVESDTDSTSLMQSSMKAMMMDDEVLPNLLTPEDHQMVLKELKIVLGRAPVKVLNKFKPSALLLLLSLHYTSEAVPELKHYKGVPMDGFFVKEAKAEGKQVIGLEDPEETFQLVFNYNSFQEQADQLVKFLKRSKEEILEEQRILADAYLNSKLTKMQALNETSFLEYGDEFMTLLLDDRNKNWIPAIEKSIKENPSFIAVGAAHLVGKNGLIELLRRQGYKVKPVQQ